MLAQRDDGGFFRRGEHRGGGFGAAHGRFRRGPAAPSGRRPRAEAEAGGWRVDAFGTLLDKAPGGRPCAGAAGWYFPHKFALKATPKLPHHPPALHTEGKKERHASLRSA